ncbi:MAG TPA: tetratricopeptide repeat protein, partial [bacterium]|nr:tetratricopeptide repeat protein [bacterium]
IAEEAFLLLGECYMMKKRDREAAACFEKVIKAGATGYFAEAALFNKGLLLCEKGDRKEAKKIFSGLSARSGTHFAAAARSYLSQMEKE